MKAWYSIFSFHNESFAIIMPRFLSVFVSLEMASPSPSIDNPTQLEYYIVRDTLLGENGVKQDVKRARRHLQTPRGSMVNWDLCWKGCDNAGGGKRSFSCS